MSPLRSAARSKNVTASSIVEMLLDGGADLNWGDFPPLFEAASHDNVKTIEVLLNRGAELHFADKEGRNALWMAATNRQIKATKMLLEKGLRLMGQARATILDQIADETRSRIKNIEKSNPFDRKRKVREACEACIKVMKMLLKEGVASDPKGFYTEKLQEFDDLKELYIAAKEGKRNRVIELLEQDVDPNSHHPDIGLLPLHGAAMMGFFDMTMILLDGGADLNRKDSGGRPPFWGAVYNNHVKVMSLLAERGAGLNFVDEKGGPLGKNFLEVAVAQGNFEAVRKLLEMEADPRFDYKVDRSSPVPLNKVIDRVLNKIKEIQLDAMENGNQAAFESQVMEACGRDARIAKILVDTGFKPSKKPFSSGPEIIAALNNWVHYMDQESSGVPSVNTLRFRGSSLPRLPDDFRKHFLTGGLFEVCGKKDCEGPPRQRSEEQPISRDHLELLNGGKKDGSKNGQKDR